jgi:type II secretory pathway pseudopilin PulG
MTPHHRSAFTLFQLLVVLAILLLLFALFLPALIKARADAERAKATNNLKQLGLALHNHNDVYGQLPAGVDDNHFSAASKLLPYIEQLQVYNQIDFKKSINDEANAAMRKIKIETFLSKADPIVSVKDEWGATNYLFNDKVFSLNSKARIPASFPDGTSNTIVIGETLKGDGKTKAEDVKRQYVALKKDALKNIKPSAGVADFKNGKNIAGDRCASWMDGRFLQGTFNGMLQPNDKRPDVSCAGLGGVSALRSFDKFVLVGLADGSARPVGMGISEFTWRNAMDPSDGNPLASDW